MILDNWVYTIGYIVDLADLELEKFGTMFWGAHLDGYRSSGNKAGHTEESFAPAQLAHTA